LLLLRFVSLLRVVAIAFTAVVLFAHVSLALGLLDTIRMGLLRIVVGARVLLLWWKNGNGGDERKKTTADQC
jgi:hypothetical protein